MISLIQPLENLAVVGIHTVLGGSDGLDAVEQSFFSVGATAAPLASSRNNGVEPLVRAAVGALRDAAVTPGASTSLAVFSVGGSLALTGWSISALSVDLSGELEPLSAALASAADVLANGQADAVLIAAAGAGGQPGGQERIFGFDRSVHALSLGEGAGAVVLMSAEKAFRSGRRIYALIRAVACAVREQPVGTQPGLVVPPALDDLRGCCVSALEGADVTPEQVGYLEAFACGLDAVDGIEIAGLVQAYRVTAQDLSTALGSIQHRVGYLGAASGLFGLIHASLCLAHRLIPAAPGWVAPKLPALWRGAPFYVPVETRSWFVSADGPGRVAGLSVIGSEGSCAHLILCEFAGQPVIENISLRSAGVCLFPIAADNPIALVNGLALLNAQIAATDDPVRLSAAWCEQAQTAQAAPYAAAVVGSGQEELAREVALASGSISQAVERGVDWQTPAGSFFTPAPVGTQGGVAFVYPGAFNTYPGVGRDLFRLFPGLYAQVENLTSDLGRVLYERMVYPRSLSALAKEDLAALEQRLLADPIAMLISGTTLAILYTHILTEFFHIQPQSAFGYSLGENSMMYATGVWGRGDDAAARLESSDVFRSRLAGPQLALREHWANSQLPTAGAGVPLWNNYLIMADPEKVRLALQNEPRVYLTHINTPRQVVIGGDPEGCQRVLKALGASSLQAPFDYALHCPPIESEMEGLAYLHDWPVERIPSMRMVSAAGYGPLEIEQGRLAVQLARMLVSPLDFPRLVHTVYGDGARVFIEVGAGSNCSRWVSESLKGLPHLALSMNRRGSDDQSTIIRTLARLHSHRVPMNLSPLFTQTAERMSA